MPRAEISVMDGTVEVVRDVELRLQERAVDDELRGGVGKLARIDSGQSQLAACERRMKASAENLPHST